MNEADRDRLSRLLVAWRHGDLPDGEMDELLRRIGDPEAQDLLAEECLLTAAIAESILEARAARPRAPRWKALAAAAAAAILLALGAILLRRPDPVPAAVVRAVRGEAFLVSPAGRAPARNGMPLPEGHGLETAAAASADIAFPDGTRLRLRGSTAVGGVRGNRLTVARGDLAAHVSPRTPGRPFAVETPHGEITVIGTTIRVRVSGAATRLDVSEGAARLRRLSDGRSVDVAAGHFAAAAEGTDLAARPLLGGPYGIAPGHESLGDHARLSAGLREAGAARARLSPTWRDGSVADALVESARRNGIEISGLLSPVRDLQAWRDHVHAVVSRYSKDIRHWEVSSESSADAKDYAEQVRAAREAARAADPECRIGISCSDTDISFLERAVVEGAGGHFDFVCVRPYALMGAVMAGREAVFLRTAANLRAMLARTRQRPDIGLWVSEIGVADDDRRQAEAAAKAFILSLAQGFERVFWFERKDWTRRPSFEAMGALTDLLGPRPEYLGWFSPGGRSRGFVFQGAAGLVLAAWAADDRGDTLRLGVPVQATDLAGRASEVKADQDLALTRSPVFVADLPERLAAEARANRDRPLPWLKDFSRAESVFWRSGESKGLDLVEVGEDRIAAGTVDGDAARRTDVAGRVFYLHFDVDDSYASIGDNEVEVTVTARRADPARNGGCNLTVESDRGYRQTDEWWTVPEGPGWHAHTFRLSDAYFSNNWGWNFRVSTVSSPGDLWVKEVVVRRVRPGK